MIHGKKIFFTLLIVLTIGFAFWTGSRYPQLNEKAMMGGEMPLSGLSFDIVHYTDASDSLWEKTYYNTINWLETNKKGMTFGILFAAGIMLLFSLVDNEKISNKFLSSFSGLLIGTPLGVCANCAAPIAKGIYETNRKPELAISVMFSSPTMNVIVLTMLFALFPFHLAAIKLGFSLLFILIGIPLLTKFINPAPVPVTQSSEKKFSAKAYRFEPAASRFLLSSAWGPSFLWTAINYFKSLWFIIRTTVPLMLLAGLLGNLAISLFSPEAAIDWLQQFDGIIISLLIIGVLSLVGTFLPVPMTFDIIVVVVLLNLGLPAKYAMPLLFTLGIFSIYPFLIVRTYISKKMATGLFLSVTAFGVLAGITAHLVDDYIENGRYRAYETLAESSKSEPKQVLFDAIELQKNQSSIPSVPVEMKEEWSGGQLLLKSRPFERAQANAGRFESHNGTQMGLQVPYSFSPLSALPPYSHGRSISSGDINNDLFPDLVITSAGNLYIYMNQGGASFQLVTLPDSLKVPETYNAALVDLNNDGWQDIFVSGFRSKNVVLYNHSGRFTSKGLRTLPTPEGQVFTEAPAFGDVDNDGRVDILLGNWTLGTLMASYSMASSQNYLLMNREEGFELKVLPGMAGETLSTMIADINNDGHADMVVANDFGVSDIFYLGDGAGNFQEVTQSDSIIPMAGYNTMSASITDVNNDLVPETYMVQIDRNLDKSLIAESATKTCSRIQDEERRNACITIMAQQQAIIKSGRKKSLDLCPPEFYEECLAFNILYDLHLQINANGTVPDLQYAQYIPESWEEYRFLPDYFSSRDRIRSKINHRTDKRGIMQQGQEPVLLQPEADGTFSNKAADQNIVRTGWAWNAKFADLDNDEWQDLFIVNGFMAKERQESNLFYRNNSGSGFSDQTEELGLVNFLPTNAYTYADFDLDGDLDIVLAPAIDEIIVYRNELAAHNSIAFQLQDDAGNHAGIGAKIFVYYGENKHQVREITLGGGFKSFDAPMAYFGLSKHEQIDAVSIHWPSGQKDSINEKLSAGKLYLMHRKKN